MHTDPAPAREAWSGPRGDGGRMKGDSSLAEVVGLWVVGRSVFREALRDLEPAICEARMLIHQR